MSTKIVLTRTDRGKLHVTYRIGRTYLAACGQKLVAKDGRDLWCWIREADQKRAWALEDQCERCAARVERHRNFRALARECGW